MVPLTGLHDVGVAADGGHGEHPERDHGGEVEGRDAGADAERGAECGEVHVLADPGHGLAQQQVGVTAAVLHHLPSPGVGISIGTPIVSTSYDKLD